MLLHLNSSQTIPVFAAPLYSWAHIWASLPSSPTAALHNRARIHSMHMHWHKPREVWTSNKLGANPTIKRFSGERSVCVPQQATGLWWCCVPPSHVACYLFFISQWFSACECDSVLTLEMVRGMLKSFPPCSLKPHGAGPFRVTVYVLIFA